MSARSVISAEQVGEDRAGRKLLRAARRTFVELRPGEIVIPAPNSRPLGHELGQSAVQEVWEAFVKPHQDADLPQSIEMRALMAILRSVYEGFKDAKSVVGQEGATDEH